MTLVRFDPFRDLDRWLGQTWPDGGRLPAFDAYRRENEVVLQFDLPGVDPDHIELTVEKGVLTVGGERQADRQEGDKVLVAHRPIGRFSRQIRLSDNLQTDRVTADYDAGVLTVRVPVAEVVRPRRIEVASGRRVTIPASNGDRRSTEDTEAPAA
jgi:HSP20 family protein